MQSNNQQTPENTFNVGDFRGNPEIKEMYSGDGGLNPSLLYFLYNKYVPDNIEFEDIEEEKLYNKLKEKYNIEGERIISSKSFHSAKNIFKFQDALLPITGKTWVYINSGSHMHPHVEILYQPNADTELVEKLIKLIKWFKKTATKNKIFLMKIQQYGGCNITPFKVNFQKMNLSLNYNDDFLPVHTKILSRLTQKNDKGLVLLHGKPGTGKTSYIRYLTSVIKKRMIFISPETAHKISSPEFLGLFEDYPNSIIVIEDAENIITERIEGDNSAISNLLNLTDGLLADCLKLQVICSFNTDISKIDKALLRKGRLIAKHEFNALKRDKAQALSDSLGFKARITSEMTLTDIYNQNELTMEENSKPIGFKLKV